MTRENLLATRGDAVLVIVDIQERLSTQMDQRKKIIANTVKLIRVAQRLDVPILWTEQYPKGLGPTEEEVSKELQEESCIEKLTFGCCETEEFTSALEKLNRRQAVLVGMESHVCVQQTALQLVSKNHAVFIPRDAVCSRKKEDWLASLDRMREAGVTITTTESMIFELLERAGTDEFKDILKLVK